MATAHAMTRSRVPQFLARCVDVDDRQQTVSQSIALGRFAGRKAIQPRLGPGNRHEFQFLGDVTTASQQQSGLVPRGQRYGYVPCSSKSTDGLSRDAGDRKAGFRRVVGRNDFFNRPVTVRGCTVQVQVVIHEKSFDPTVRGKPARKPAVVNDIQMPVEATFESISVGRVIQQHGGGRSRYARRRVPRRRERPICIQIEPPTSLAVQDEEPAARMLVYVPLNEADNVAVVGEHLRKVELRPHDFAGTIINCVANEDPDRTTAGIEDPRNRQRIKPRKLQRV